MEKILVESFGRNACAKMSDQLVIQVRKTGYGTRFQAMIPGSYRPLKSSWKDLAYGFWILYQQFQTIPHVPNMFPWVWQSILVIHVYFVGYKIFREACVQYTVTLWWPSHLNWVHFIFVFTLPLWFSNDGVRLKRRTSSWLKAMELGLTSWSIKIISRWPCLRIFFMLTWSVPNEDTSMVSAIYHFILDSLLLKLKLSLHKRCNWCNNNMSSKLLYISWSAMWTDKERYELLLGS